MSRRSWWRALSKDTTGHHSCPSYRSKSNEQMRLREREEEGNELIEVILCEIECCHSSTPAFSPLQINISFSHIVLKWWTVSPSSGLDQPSREKRKNEAHIDREVGKVGKWRKKREREATQFHHCLFVFGAEWKLKAWWHKQRSGGGGLCKGNMRVWPHCTHHAELDAVCARSVWKFQPTLVQIW